MSSALIVRDDAALSIKLTERAEHLKSWALEKAALIAVVRNVDEQRDAVSAQMDLDNLYKESEKARVAAKEPIFEYGRAIDGQVKAWREELQSESMRLSQAIGNYQQEQLEICRRAQRERDEELRKIEEEKRAAIVKAIHGIVIGEEESENERAQLLAESVRQEEIAQQKIESLKPVPMPAKVTGQSVSQPWRWELVNIDLLYRMHPGLVTRTTNAREIGETIKLLAARGQEPKIHGLRIWQETVSTTRATTRKAIDV